VPQHPALPHRLTIEQLAEHLSVTPHHVRRLVAERRVLGRDVMGIDKRPAAVEPVQLPGSARPPRPPLLQRPEGGLDRLRHGRAVAG
jgi:hypothetical protein